MVVGGIPPKGSIPANVRTGVVSTPSFKIHRAGKEKKPDRKTLGNLLEWGQREEQKCINLLKTLPPELLEYNEVLASLSKVQDKVCQIKTQMGGNNA